jgi:hypothetical protein
LFGHAKNNPGPGGVHASALVVDGDSGISGTTSWSSLARLRVMIPDRPPVAVTHECMVKRGKELVEGFTIPIRVDPADPAKLEIIWDEVPTIEQRIADRDPAILDPEGTWERLRADQFANLPPSVPKPASPWAEKTIEGWPPAEPLPKGRQPGTAWIIASSLDARNCQVGGDSVMPPGRTHYRCSGPVSYGAHSFMTWLLARINPQYGEPYGAYWRTNAVRWRFSSVLPVALTPNDPTDIDVCWDAATNVAEKYAEKINTGVADAHARVEAFTIEAAEAGAQALTNIADPAMRQQAAKLMTSSGMIDSAAAAAAVSAPPPSGLERLERLRDTGILSDAEFDAERAKLEAQQ